MDRKNTGMGLIVLGVLAWPVGFGLHVDPFPTILFFHLLFIFSGVYLRKTSDGRN
ncbi:MAG: hypothetical protein ACE5PM_02825 [Candidatus Hydrothermarchaeales archaeon]